MTAVPWTELELLLRVTVAVVLAAFVGWERERNEHPAGLRTHALVGAAAALAVGLADAAVADAAFVLAPKAREFVEVDPTRAVQAVLTGIGFVGAGTILVNPKDDRVKGLTTAASVFATAAIGCAAGMGHYVLAAGTTALLVIVLWPLGLLDAHISKRNAGRVNAE